MMARDDYPVIVYQILAYLYQCLKSGKKVEGKDISYSNKYFTINENYWRYIIVNLIRSGYIEGVKEVKTMEPLPNFTNLDDCVITPKGIEYLMDNSFIEKAKDFLKDVKSIVPFI